MRLIDADVVKDNIAEWLDCVGTVLIGKGLSYTWELEGCINDAPTIDAELVRHGRWIGKEEKLWNLDFPFVVEWQCSVCGVNGYIDFEYCPYCGAKMDAKDGVNDAVD